MPAVSKAQRRLMAMWSHGVKTRKPKPKSLSRAEASDFASTPERGLPKRRPLLEASQ